MVSSLLPRCELYEADSKMEFNLTKDYLGLSDVVFVNDEGRESHENVCIDATERKQEENPKVRRASLLTPNMTGNFQGRALSTPKISTEARSMGHLQRERSEIRREHYETQNMFQQRVSSPMSKRYEVSNVFQQSQKSRIDQEQDQRNQCGVFQCLPFTPKEPFSSLNVLPQRPNSPQDWFQRPTSPRDWYQPPQRPKSPRDWYQSPQRPTSPRERYQPPQQPISPRERYQPPHRPNSPRERYQPPHRPNSPRDWFQPTQRPTSPREAYQSSNLFQRYSGTRMPVTGGQHFSESYACVVSPAKRTRKTSTKQLCQTGPTGPTGPTGQVHLCEVSETFRYVGTERPKCTKSTKTQYNTPVSEGNADNCGNLRPFSIQKSETLSLDPSLSVTVDVTGSQWSTKSGPIAKSYKHECKFCKTNGETKVFYMSHDLKDAKGRVTCPVLRTFRCPICKATGDYAHTVTYCPFGSGQCTVMVTSKTPRMSCGRPRLLDH